MTDAQLDDLIARGKGKMPADEVIVTSARSPRGNSDGRLRGAGLRAGAAGRAHVVASTQRRLGREPAGAPPVGGHR